MRANLARHARRVLIQQSRSPSCALYSAPTRRRQLTRPIVHDVPYRTFFDGMFKKAPREVRQPEFEPGWMKIMVWRSRMLDNLRPPPTDELIHAWKALFDAKLSSRVPLNASQALQCHRLLEYLLQQLSESPANTPLKLDHKDLVNALTALRTLRPRERTPQHLDLAKSIYSLLTSGTLRGKKKKKDKGSDTVLWAQYIHTICLYGGSKEALKLLHANWGDLLDLAKHGDNLAVPVARGLAREGHEQELVALVEHAEKNGLPFDKDTQMAIVSFFAKRDQVPETKQWFTKLPASGLRTAEVYPLIATFAVRNNVQEWAVPHFLELGDTKPEKPYWDSLLHAILVMGKGLKQVEAMMSHMADSAGPVNADTTTINGLLRAAVGLKDPMMAEDILSLAAEKNLRLDGETYLIQMGLRLEAGYLPGVQAAYKSVKKLEPWHSDPDRWWEYCQLLNRYLSVLCAQEKPDFNRLGELVQLAEEDQVQLDPQTLASLCVRFLENEQHFDVMDILSVHAFQFSAAEREVVQEAFIKFCLNPETSTSRAWTSYQVLRQFFQDLSFEHRVSLIDAFFDRKRSDMASHVFGHMRQHRNSDYHPQLDTYIRFFEGLGQYPDTEALEMVYNMLKMDTTVQPNTRLYTSLMLAHTACDRPLQALDFWTEITSSREGPTYASLEAVFWALERRPGGSKVAQRVWKRIENMDVDIPPAVYNAYIGAIAGNGEEQEVQNIILRMGKITGVEPEAMT
ncbi:Complex I intermediate-associated protein 84, mitochondrial [Neonectria ditissima]|uniref:Complex I intermediate-associated protein 84, mitochondrial n=1 Tax=Neonectria ditissima TaxID=78410 RepID=A0A0P7B4X1_9HYPO|nr:Complex I intermediate-associated protein 84, mitochondrial [Neonectria ditissima]